MFHPDTRIFTSPSMSASLLLLCLLLALVSSSGASIFSSSDKSATQDSRPAQEQPLSAASPETAATSAQLPSAADDEQFWHREIPGVGAVFGHMLDSLILLTLHSESRLARLAADYPSIFPDLYKVFITL